ncbi:non-oxidative hydroxyarylic acid decarboxylases subunit B [Pseudomonas oryzihabitans]|uniref:Flavin prenyltransferase UbiX n=1 Tax=Pseudomonas oryzihabitans TaxID=47885 RepID=A0AAJ2BEX9_9PSED|nr:non-oxidative hydroxyarylic acid decarboxylases subunit B [Pseudomonas psychrotolerans]MDR6232834.1 4-hydroxy-3-polyprenylbenzoate decarboxylase [Pseudomonas psychrotolerans]MDR6358226.1 4-hydroxy-3-polyprenylbenzoate decarboxylase [Pseudomonas psychrotolerans]MDR6677637.1 4-hydroxy-3-polyprenylbenzoate decarboxylase [Pseudomonas psychrotolerans]QDD87529.1 phenolic acid decarboxylase [Pseudomonas psychrotolerans]
MRLIVAITGATGAPLAVSLLEALNEVGGVEVHLIMSKWARVTIQTETGRSATDLAQLVAHVHSASDQGASISSGSFLTDGMVIIPCSMKTLAGIRVGFADGLISRAADVILKEQRKLVLVPRETPLNSIHLENMLALSRMGVSIVPPMPAYYNHPQTIDDVTDHIVARVLDQFGLRSKRARRWEGLAT